MKGHHKQRNDYQKKKHLIVGFLAISEVSVMNMVREHGCIRSTGTVIEAYITIHGQTGREEWKDGRQRERQKLREGGTETETERDSACLTWAFETSKPKPCEIPHSTKPHQLQLGHTS